MSLNLRGPSQATLMPLAAQRHARALIQKLGIGKDPVGTLVLGDSLCGTVSGNTATVYWYYLTMAALAAKFPAYSATYLCWDDTTQAYLMPTKIQTGSGGDRYFRPVNGTAYMTTPDSAATSVTGDLDVRVKLAHDAWTSPASQSAIAAKQEGAGQRSWTLELGTTGRPTFNTSADGTNVLIHTATAAVPFTNGQAGWVRATLDVDNGAAGHTVTFYTSTDGTTWTQLGSPVVTAGTTSVFDSTSATYFPGRTGGGYNPGGASFYELQVLNGIGGTPVVLCDLDAMPLIGATFTGYSGNVWTINNPGTGNESRGGAPGFAIFNGGRSGEVIAYSNDATRFPKQTPYPCDVAFINYSENEGSASVAYRAAYKQLADAIVAKWADCRIVACVQPTQLPPCTVPNITAHDIRCGQIAALASTADYGVIDVRAAYGANTASYLQADGIHPTYNSPNSGAQKWADEATARLLTPWLRLLGL